MVIGCLWLSDSALYTVLSTSIWHHRKFGEVSCTECTGQGNNYKLIPTVKMETRKPLKGNFGSEFPAICNHCSVMAALSRKTLNIFEKFFHFFEKKPLTVKFSKLCSKSFHHDTQLTCCVQISWNLDNGKLVKSCVAYLNKKNKFRLAIQLSLLRG